MSRDGTLARAVRERLERQRKEVVPLGDPEGAASDVVWDAGDADDHETADWIRFDAGGA